MNWLIIILSLTLFGCTPKEPEPVFKVIDLNCKKCMKYSIQTASGIEIVSVTSCDNPVCSEIIVFPLDSFRDINKKEKLYVVPQETTWQGVSTE